MLGEIFAPTPDMQKSKEGRKKYRKMITSVATQGDTRAFLAERTNTSDLMYDFTSTQEGLNSALEGLNRALSALEGITSTLSDLRSDLSDLGSSGLFGNEPVAEEAQHDQQSACSNMLMR
jgi:cob(I)alamin adenosyltransferase